MTIQSETYIWLVECDNCETTEEFDRPSKDFDQEYFFEMVQQLKEDGWQIFKDSLGYWNHLCPECNEKNS